jgi:molybdopterin molybdotransferase
MVDAVGAETVFHKVTQKPGKPLLFACGHGKLVFGLPGNARSTHFCFDRYVAPALRAWSGRPPVRPCSSGLLTRPYATEGDRTLFVPMLAEPGERCEWRLTPFDERGSADIYNPARGNVYVRFETGTHTLGAGASLPFSWMGDGHG